MSAPATTPARTYRLPEGSAWRGAWKKLAFASALGFAASLFGLATDPSRFGFSYLFAFVVFLSVALGGLFFVLVQHLTSAHWSVTVRRSSELLMAGLPIFALLVLPLLADLDHLYPWATGRHAEPTMQAGAFGNAADEGSLEPAALAHANEASVEVIGKARAASEARVLAGKTPYLNKPFFRARAVIYLLLWSLFSRKLFQLSTTQDATGAHANTVAAQRLAPIGAVVFAVTLVLASIDWLMSLDPMWYSTIFGVYFFSICGVAHAAALIVLTRLLHRSGLLEGALSVEHSHDLGKFLFGWIAFWAYIAFIQFFLIWYANVPDELTFFHLRWNDNLGSWKLVSASLFLVRFVVPFWLLISRNVKRNVGVLLAVAALALAMHVVEIYWIVMPNRGPLALHWLDLTCLIAVGGAYLATVLRALEQHALVPVGDPRLARSLHFENA